jgi:hypothetical protein
MAEPEEKRAQDLRQQNTKGYNVHGKNTKGAGGTKMIDRWGERGKGK